MNGKEELYERLRKYAASDFYPWHMPGHKRRLVEFDNPFSMDITEIDGFDDLHHPEGILKEAMEEAAAVYGSEKTYFLVNGSSCGILAAVSAAVPPGGKLLMARNCHKSAYHAALLQQARVTYIYPELEAEGFYGAVRAEDVEAALQADPDIRAVIVVSPGYEGIVSDIRAIAEAAHAHDCALLVDEAHGAHLPFGKGCGLDFPASALEMGADAVIQSLHKTLPSLTQTALLHLGRNSGARMDRDRVELYLRIYQSSSPSYIFMASIDHCIRLMAGEAGKPYTSILYPDGTIDWEVTEEDLAALPPEAEPTVIYSEGFTISVRTDGSKVVTYDGEHGDQMLTVYLAPDFDTVVAGKWEQSWTLSYQDLSTYWKGEAELFDPRLTLTEHRLSPLSWEARFTAREPQG